MGLRHRGASAAAWVALSALTVLPLLALSVQAVATGWFFPDLIPRDWTLGAFRRLAGDARTRSSVINSIEVGVAVTVVSVALAIPAARALVLGRIRHARLIGFVFLLPIALPPVAVAMGLNVALLRLGATGGLAPVVLAHLVATLPYTVLVLAAALTRYDAGYERQAAVLGAGAARILGRVFLPLAAPAIFVAAALTFVVSWSQYLLTLLPGGGRVITLPVLLLAASGGGNPTVTAALALVAALPPAIAILIVVRHLDGLGAEARS